MTVRIYHDFVIFADDVESDQHGRVRTFSVRVFDSPVGQGEKQEIVVVPEKVLDDAYEFAQAMRMLEKREFDSDVEKQRRLGEVFAGLLLPPYARDLFQRSLTWLRHEDEGIRLRLRLADPLTAWPWEYLYVQDTRGERTSSGFLALDPRISIVRHEALPIPAEWFAPVAQRRVVLAMASPQPYAQYPKLENLPIEQQKIRTMLGNVAGLTVDYLPEYVGTTEAIPGVRVQDLFQALAHPADIFHFSGHGEFMKTVGPGGESLIGEGAIILAGDNNLAVPLPAERLAELVRGRGIRLAVLGACETGQRDSFHVWSSVAASLLKAGIPAVLAMQFSIKDDLAATFMVTFYQALVGGALIDEAVAAGRAAIRIKALAGSADIRDWGVPVLYLRTPGGRIFNPVTDEVVRQDAEKATHQIVTQQLGTVARTGRVVGSVTKDVQVDKVNVVQTVTGAVEGLMLGNYAVNFQGGTVTIQQRADVVSGTLIGSVMAGNGGADWLGVEKWLQKEFQPAVTVEPKSSDASTRSSSGDTCSSCGKAVSSDAKFCIHCGHQLVQARTFCPQCGAQLGTDAKFCMKCGTKVTVP